MNWSKLLVVCIARQALAAVKMSLAWVGEIFAARGATNALDVVIDLINGLVITEVQDTVTA